MTEDRVNRVRVRTPEGVVFTFQLAGPVTRGIAWVLDTVMIAAASAVLGLVLVWGSIISVDWTVALLTVLYFVLGTGYFMVLEYVWRGQTIGKRTMRLRVIDAGGLALTPAQVVVRNLLRVVDQLPLLYLVGGAAMILTRRAQRLGDLAAATIVIRHRLVREPDLESLTSGRFNSLRALPGLSMRLRQRVPPVLAAAAVDALVRREALDPDARVGLFGELAAALRQLVEFPEHVLVDLPDEAFVRNVVEIVHTHPGEGSPREPSPADRA